MKLDGKPFVDLSKSQWNSLPTMKIVELVKGKRYPIEITRDRPRIGRRRPGVEARSRTRPDAALTAAAAKADVLVAVVGLTSDLEAEESPVEVPGLQGRRQDHARPAGRPDRPAPEGARPPASRWWWWR